MAILSKLFGKVLYYPGCSSKFFDKDIYRRHEHLLTTFGIEYIKLPDIEVCCGLPALNLGYRDDFQSLINKNNRMFRNQRIKMIITSCPTCYRVFKEYYNIEVKHILEIILENIEQLKKDFKGEEISYYDPCNPSKIDAFYSNPREILSNINVSVVELERNKDRSMCCGFVLRDNSPKIANRMAEQVLEMVKTKKIVTTCPSCYIHLKENTKDVEVFELSEVLI